MNSMSTTDYDQFLSQFPMRQYPKGRMLIMSKTNPECLFLLVTGKVRKYDVTRYGEQVVINVFKAPALFPLSWVLNGTPNRYYYEASTRVTVRCVPTEEFAGYLQSHPDLAYSLLCKVYEGLEESQRRVVHMTRGNARSKLLFELGIEARRSGEVQPNGSIIITVHETELAERAGLSRETISRELVKLCRSSDVCKRRGRSVVIDSLPELDKMLEKIV